MHLAAPLGCLLSFALFGQFALVFNELYPPELALLFADKTLWHALHL